jgi:hypothetical protein
MAVRTMFPTLADAPRDRWPTNLRVHPAPAHVGGSVETIQCRCMRTVPADEMVDLRELSAAVLTGLGLTVAVECQACFHHHLNHGRALHSEIATALGMDAGVIASMARAETEMLQRGWSVRTAMNTHLVPLPTEPLIVP